MNLNEMNLPKIEQAAANDAGRPTLCSVNWTGREFQACDGWIAARVAPDNPPDDLPAIIHLDGWKLAQGEKASLEITGKNTAWVDTGGGLIVVYNGADYYGLYPDLDVVGPKATIPTFTVDARELASLGVAVKLSTSGGVKASPDHEPKNLAPVEVGSLKVVHYHEPPATIELNAQLLLRLAQAIMLPVTVARRHSYPVTLAINGKDHSPIMVYPATDQAGFVGYGLIMPLRNRDR